MTELLPAIQSVFSNDAALKNVFPNGLYLSQAPDGVSLPIAVLNVVSAVPQYNTGTNALTVYSLQFSVFTTSDVTAINGTSSIKKAFDFVTLEMPTQQCVEFRRINEAVMRQDERVWQAYVEYQCWLAETLPVHRPNVIVNGGFIADLSGWDVLNSVSWSNGTAKLQGESLLTQSVTLAPGQTYDFAFDVAAINAGNLFMGYAVIDSDQQNLAQGQITQTGTVEASFVATTVDATIQFSVVGTPGYNIDNISLR